MEERLRKAIKNNSPAAVSASKQLVAAVAGKPITDDIIADTAQRLADVRASAGGREGLTAFLEKRKPGWIA